MSSLRRASKSVQHLHRERGQSIGRKGYLEKKKDYQLRASWESNTRPTKSRNHLQIRDYHKKQDAIVALERQALNRNPDEFYFKMVKTVKKEGLHQEREREPGYTHEQMKLMQTQDLRYINFKCSTEAKKIEKLKSELHLLDSHDKPKNKHIVFVDSKKKVREFDVAKHFDTHPQFIDRAYNRPHLNTIVSMDMSDVTQDNLKQINSQHLKQYKELEKRIMREKELKLIAEKIKVHKRLLDKKARREKISDETRTSAAQYKWRSLRKR